MVRYLVAGVFRVKWVQAERHCPGSLRSEQLGEDIESVHEGPKK